MLRCIARLFSMPESRVSHYAACALCWRNMESTHHTTASPKANPTFLYSRRRSSICKHDDKKKKRPHAVHRKLVKQKSKRPDLKQGLPPTSGPLIRPSAKKKKSRRWGGEAGSDTRCPIQTAELDKYTKQEARCVRIGFWRLAY